MKSLKWAVTVVLRDGSQFRYQTARSDSGPSPIEQLLTAPATATESDETKQ